MILKCMSLDIRFSSTNLNDLSFNYWELMSWRALRRQSTWVMHLALRCVKNIEIVELEVSCYQVEAIDILEAHIMLFTSKLSAGVNQITSRQRAPKKGKPAPPKGKPAPQKRASQLHPKVRLP